MLTIYHIEGRRSERVAWLMEELGLPYRLEFTPGDIMASARAIKALHPIGAAPTVRDGEVWLCESAAILEYVIARYGEGRFSVSPAAPEYPAYLQWLHFAEGSAMMRIAGEYLVAPLLKETQREQSAVGRVYLGAAQRMLAFFELSLADRPYFAGESFTAADIMMLMPVRMGLMQCPDGDFPRVKAWRERVERRPAYARMLARAQPNGPPSPGGAPARGA